MVDAVVNVKGNQTTRVVGGSKYTLGYNTENRPVSNRAGHRLAGSSATKPTDEVDDRTKD